MKSIKLKNEVQKRLAKNDPAHDFEHILRVYKNAEKIGKKEKTNMRLVRASVLLHDIVSYQKSDKRSKNASTQSAQQAAKILKKYGYRRHEIGIITQAIREHSFSKGMVPSTLEGKILQDADRLDALGAIGIARTFAVGGAEKRSFYNKNDPFCHKRSPNDQKWTLDHFYKKLLLLEKKMNTKTAKKEARHRTNMMKKFLNNLKKEI
ncbi:MAG TPA: HD domain-containing protein [Nitrosopumilaceae archaeon]|nr:HD domain-containing protein [Nitrosopumilaceae archaeon]